jgi:hypothetical protein
MLLTMARQDQMGEACGLHDVDPTVDGRRCAAKPEVCAQLLATLCSRAHEVRLSHALAASGVHSSHVCTHMPVLHT